jgi:type IV secretion system protein VirD4
MSKVTLFMKSHILPALPYAVIFWFGCKLSEAWRLAAGVDLFQRLAHIRTAFGSAVQNPLPSFYPVDLLAGFIAAAAIFGIVAVKKSNAKKWRKDVEYGSARWGTKKDIEPFMDSKPQNNIILTQTEGLTMNPRPSNPKYARNKNMLVIGGSGSGKTRFIIKPNIMQAAYPSSNHPVSLVCTDPKGELLRDCGTMLRRAGFRIKIFNTINFSKSMRYNPLAYIRSEKDILKLVTTLIANTKGDQKGGDGFWEKAETLLYTALIAYLHYESPESEQNFATLAEMVGAMEVREDDETYKNIVDLMFDALEEKDPEHFAVRQYRRFKLAAGKTLKSILISCAARISVFDIAEIRDLTMYDELALDTLGDEKTALFIIISDTDASFNFLVSMAYTQLFNLLCEKAEAL